MIKENLLKFIAALTICFAVHVLVALFSSLIVNNFILNTRLANFTIYEGYADLNMFLAYIPISALLVFKKIKGNILVIATTSFAVLLLAKTFVIDMLSHYLRFYVKTQQNGSYSFEVFKHQIGREWDSLLWEFSNLGQFFSTIFWLFIAILSICYLSPWAKTKLTGNRKTSPAFALLLVLGLSSCGDNIQREKDKYPEIPEFPLFKDQKFVLKKLDVATVNYKKYQSAKVDGQNLVIHTQDYFYYCLADQALFIITGYREAMRPGNPYPAKNFVKLRKISGEKVLKLAWTDTCENDLPIFNDGKTLIVGSRIFNANADQLTFTKVAKDDDGSISESTKVYTWDFSNKMISEEYKPYDSTFVKEFDRVTIGSSGHLSGGLNNGINYTYDPVPLIYYEFNLNGKIGKTKINFDEQKAPLILKVADKIYCITYSYDLNPRLEIVHYEIGILK